MPRITIYSSIQPALTDGTSVSAIQRWVSNVNSPPLPVPVPKLKDAVDEETSARTASLRLIGVGEDIRFVSYEFFMEFTAPTDVIALRWFQEFYNDDASAQVTPTTFPPAHARQNNGFAANEAVWMREVALVDGGVGNLDHYPITRRMTMRPAAYVPITSTHPHQQCLHVPLSVHSSWVRLAFWFDMTQSVIADPEAFNLYIMGHVGGHTEIEYLYGFNNAVPPVNNVGVPYAYDAYIGKPQPEGVKVIKKGNPTP